MDIPNMADNEFPQSIESTSQNSSESFINISIVNDSIKVQYEPSSTSEESVKRSSQQIDNGVIEDFMLTHFTGRLRISIQNKKDSQSLNLKTSLALVKEDNIDDSFHSLESCSDAIAPSASKHNDKEGENPSKLNLKSISVLAMEDKSDLVNEPDSIYDSYNSSVQKDDKKEGCGDNDEIDEFHWEAGPGSTLHDLCSKTVVTIGQLREALDENPQAPFQTNELGQTPLHVLSENLTLWYSPIMTTIVSSADDFIAPRKNVKENEEIVAILLDFGIELITINPTAMALCDCYGRFPCQSILKTWTQRQFIQTEEKDLVEESKNTLSGTKQLFSDMNKKLAKLGRKKKYNYNPKVEASSNDNLSFGHYALENNTLSTTFSLNSRKINFPKAKLSYSVRIAMHWISVSFNTTTITNSDGVTTSWPREFQQKLRDIVCRRTIQVIPYFLPTLLLIETNSVRKSIFKNSPFVRRLLLEGKLLEIETSSKIKGPWYLTMLKQKGIPSQTAIDFLESLCSATIYDYSNIPPNEEQKKQYEEYYEREIIERIANSSRILFPSLSILPDEEIDRASHTSLLWKIIEKEISLPMVISFGLIDFAVTISMLVSFRIIVTEDFFFPNSQYQFTNVIIYISFCFNLIHFISQAFALNSISRSSAKNFLTDTWNILHIFTNVMVLISSAITHWDIRTGNKSFEYKVEFDTVVVFFLYLHMLKFIRTISEPMAGFILSITQCFKIFIPFIIIILIILLMFTDILQVILREGHCEKVCNDDSCLTDDADYVLVEMFDFLMGNIPRGKFECTRSDFEHNVLVNIWLILFQIAGIIVMLNMLIAVVCDAYATGMGNSKKVFGRSRVYFIAEIISLEKFLLPSSNHTIQDTGKKYCLRGMLIKGWRWLSLFILSVSPPFILLYYTCVLYIIIKEMKNPIGVEHLIITIFVPVILTISSWPVLKLLIASSIKGRFCYVPILTPIIRCIDQIMMWALFLLGRLFFGQSVILENINK